MMVMYLLLGSQVLMIQRERITRAGLAPPVCTAVAALAASVLPPYIKPWF